MPTTEIPPPARRRRVRTLLLVALGAALLAGSLTGMGLGLQRWTHPTVFDNVSSFYEAARPGGDLPLVTGFGGGDLQGDHETLTFDSARVRYAPNGAGAKGTVVVCTPRPGRGHLGEVNEEPVDPTTDELGKFCSRARRVTHGTTMAFGESATSDYLLLVTQPSGPGRSVVRSVALDYRRSARHLWQHGTERFDVDVSVDVAQSAE